VDCQWACPAHTPVPEYIRLIAQERYTEAYMLNWDSNVFPGDSRPHLRPALRAGLPPGAHGGEAGGHLPAEARCRRPQGRHHRLPAACAQQKNGKRVALLGAGPASLAVARDLLPHGYEVHLYEKDPFGGGMMRTQIPAFRLPADVLEEEVNLILNMGVECHFGHEVTSMKSMLDLGFDAYFIGTGAPRGRDLDLPGRQEADAHISIGIDWLSSVAFGHTTKIEGKVIVWAAAIPPWIAAGPPSASAPRACTWWCARPSR
jgi:formate dehydrogenase (NADP+) beta subunit